MLLWIGTESNGDHVDPAGQCCGSTRIALRTKSDFIGILVHTAISLYLSLVLSVSRSLFPSISVSGTATAATVVTIMEMIRIVEICT